MVPYHVVVQRGLILVGLLILPIAPLAQLPSQSQEAATAAVSVVNEMLYATTLPMRGCGVPEAPVTSHYAVVIGLCAGWTGIGDHDLLIGNCVQADAKHKPGFVNIGNKLCYYRDNPVHMVKCPELLPSCPKEYR